MTEPLTEQERADLRPIPGWPGRYAHPSGFVVSTTRRTTKTYGHRSSNGYLQADWGSRPLIHRLVARAFLPNPHDYSEVNHLNGDIRDNRVENLAWCSPEQNVRHANEVLGAWNGERNGRAKLTEGDVRAIRILGKSRLTNPQIAHLFGVGREAVRRVIQRKRWKHVG
jgi:hypothetical protein